MYKKSIAVVIACITIVVTMCSCGCSKNDNKSVSKGYFKISDEASKIVDGDIKGTFVMKFNTLGSEDGVNINSDIYDIDREKLDDKGDSLVINYNGVKKGDIISVQATTSVFDGVSTYGKIVGDDKDFCIDSDVMSVLLKSGLFNKYYKYKIDGHDGYVQVPNVHNNKDNNSLVGKMNVASFIPGGKNDLYESFKDLVQSYDNNIMSSDNSGEYISIDTDKLLEEYRSIIEHASDNKELLNKLIRFNDCMSEYMNSITMNSFGEAFKSVSEGIQEVINNPSKINEYMSDDSEYMSALRYLLESFRGTTVKMQGRKEDKTYYTQCDINIVMDGVFILGIQDNRYCTAREVADNELGIVTNVIQLDELNVSDEEKKFIDTHGYLNSESSVEGIK